MPPRLYLRIRRREPLRVDERLPHAFRARAYYRTSRWLRRRVCGFRYDVLREDGGIDRDIALAEVMYRRVPADFQVTGTGMMEHTPDVGTGAWIGYARGFPVNGPAWTHPVPVSAVPG